ncbi:tryptophan aminotransferase-related protein 1-like isoform X2 [Zingiber officinale]|uniref:tryptophan aminotransferase-related protein 1-like isoform X2 n=1 Tax=Zingiber officinale TaxID=94328 RepID=UPI001C4C20D1|nr:tryptophan aminotransferase-related protein 1-like isoform X2 [Zingiber officinale]
MSLSGDSTMYEAFWKSVGAEADTLIAGWTSMSYSSDITNLCWFLEPQLAHQIRRLHKFVGNAVAGVDRFIIVGTGSSQLIQASLYALSPPDAAEPMSVVSLAPYCPSSLHKWAGDASKFTGYNYIELVCTTNGPDDCDDPDDPKREAILREALLSFSDRKTVHDLAYYWPQYTPITHRADHDIMLFTPSKSTGHAGSRIGWALVKDRAVAKRMMQYVELNTMGVAKEAQLRASKILQLVCDAYEDPERDIKMKLFEFAAEKLGNRWGKLKKVGSASSIFTVPSFDQISGLFTVPCFTMDVCYFFEDTSSHRPAFAWLECEKDEVEDPESYLKEKGIVVRGGSRFGIEARYVLFSMLDDDQIFDLYLQRLAALS